MFKIELNMTLVFLFQLQPPFVISNGRKYCCKSKKEEDYVVPRLSKGIVISSYRFLQPSRCSGFSCSDLRKILFKTPMMILIRLLQWAI